MKTSWRMPRNHVGEETASAALTAQLRSRLVSTMMEEGAGEAYKDSCGHVYKS